MKKCFKQYEEAAPYLAILIILVIFFFFQPSNFMNMTYFALVALTAVYAYATIRVVGENRRAVEEMRQARLDAVKPALSLQPEGFTFGGGFSVLYLVNSGGVAKDVKIDIEVTNPDSKKVLFVPAINREHKVYLEVGGEVQDKGGLIKVNVNFKDSYNQSFTESLSIDFSELKKEGRKIWGQYSELYEISKALKDIKQEVSKIKKG
jgi:hypothetical protein